MKKLSSIFRKAIANTLKSDDVKASDYDSIFFAGGHGTMWDFADSPAVLKLVPEFKTGTHIIVLSESIKSFVPQYK